MQNTTIQQKKEVINLASANVGAEILLGALLTSVGKGVEASIKNLSISNIGNNVLYVEYNQATSANSYRLQVGDGITFRIAPEGVSRIRVACAVASQETRINIQQEGD